MAGFNLVPPNPPVVLAGANAAVVDPGGGSSSGPIPVAGVAYDWLIDGNPFLFWPSEEDPYIRDTKEDVKDQFDSSREAGEQSFGYWWLRSQASYHGGAGQLYLDTEQDDATRLRYYLSNYVDPFTTLGQFSVNEGFSRQTVSRRASALVTWNGVPRLATASATDNTVTVADIPDLTSPDEIELGSTGVCQAICSDGENLYVAVNDKVWRIDSSEATTDCGDVTFTGPVTIGFAKGRVILTTGPEVYEIDPSGGTASYTATYTHPSDNWRYTAIADGPNGIYLAGYLGPLSELALMTVQDAGDGLELSQPVVQLRTPPSEIINGIAFYLNAFFGLATSNGIRIGSFTPYGQPQYGPVLNPGNPVYSVAGSGSYLYFGGANRVWTVDLGTQIAEGRFAYSQYGDNINPLSSSDPVTSLEVAVVNDSESKLFGVQASGAVIYQPSEPVLPLAGTLTTSWARFGTVEPKRLHYIRVEGTFPVPETGPAMTMLVESIDGASKTFQVPGGKNFYEFGITDFAASEAFRIRFTLFPGSVMRSWQFKGRPAPLQYQEFIVPLGCWDTEMAADGQEVGYAGYAMARLLKLEEAARSNRVVTAVDRWANTQHRVQISRCQFRQTVHPGRTERNGGKVTLVLRLI